MQVTAFGANNNIDIKGCEDYKNTFARMESDYTLRFGFKALIKSISYTKGLNLFLHFLRTLKCFSRPRGTSLKCLAMADDCCFVLLHDYITRITQVTLKTIKQHTADLQFVALFYSHLVLVQFFGSQTQAGWWCVLLDSDPY